MSDAMKTFALISDTTDNSDKDHPKRTVRLQQRQRAGFTVTYTYYPKHKVVLVGAS